MTKNIFIGTLVVLVLVFGGLYFGSVKFGGAGTGQNHYQAENFLEGLFGGTLGQFKISRLGVVTQTASTTLTGVTALGNCGTSNYTVPALSPRLSTAGASWTTSSVSVAGSTLGDVTLTSFNSSTAPLTQYGVSARSAITTSDGTSTVMFFNETNVTSTAITTGTLRVCFFR